MAKTRDRVRFGAGMAMSGSGDKEPVERLSVAMPRKMKKALYEQAQAECVNPSIVTRRAIRNELASFGVVL